MASPADLIQAVDSAVTRVRTRAVDVSFNELFDMHQSKELIIDPDFQRLFRWSVGKQSQFIESLILELPVPPIYVIEVEDGVYELIDGLQRVSSYFHFRGFLPAKVSEVSEEADTSLVLSECDVLPELNGKKYTELPQSLQIKLKRHFIRMEVLRRESDKRLRYHMFKRLNTGGEILSPQEVRNCTIRLLDNTFNAFLKELATTPEYRRCMESLSDEKKEQMYLEEYVLRFFALKNNGDKYSKEVGDFLTEYMESLADSEKSVTFDYHFEKEAFTKTFSFLATTLSSSAFSGVSRTGNIIDAFSALLFEALTMGVQPRLAELSNAGTAVRDKFVAAVNSAKGEPEFQKWTKGGGKNYAAALRARVDHVKRVVDACLI
ncbi:MAG: DUF262 domain-containing protein [Janthinobacterium lividum]